MMRRFLVPAGAFVVGGVLAAAAIGAVWTFDRLIGRPYA